jgi:NAD(P)-dependent dehydrogenase (short-subunit alcohol dehydrogenase family)
MELTNKVVVVTGGAQGIGKAMCERFAREGAKVMVADLNLVAAQAVAQAAGGLAMMCDVSDEKQIQALVVQTEKALGPIDLFCSNAGIAVGDGGPNATSADNTVWQRCWEIHVMAHVYAARAVLPAMIERGSGYFLQTVSAAGLLNQIGDAAYSTTKHAALGSAESLAITHGDEGIKVSALCPQYVATQMIGHSEDNDLSQQPGIITAEQAVERVMQGLAEEKFLILTHDDVQTYRQRKAVDYDRWLSGMRRLRKNLLGV